MNTSVRPVIAIALALGLVVVGATQALTDRGPQTRTVELVIEHSRYVDADGRPIDAISVDEGETVRFVVHNRDPIDHEAIAGDLGTQRGHEAGTDRHHDGAHGAVSVPAGATGETTHTFTGGGTQWVGCHLPGHWDHGMRVPVAVHG